MSKKIIRLTEGQLRQIIRETRKQNIIKEGLADIPRHIWRATFGQVESAKEISELAFKLHHVMIPSDPEWKILGDALVGSLRSLGVDHRRPEAGGLNIFDHVKLQKVIDDYAEDPRASSSAADKFDSTMRELRNVLDAFIKGKKV